MLKESEKAGDGFAKGGRGCNQAEDQVIAGGEVIEMARVDENVVVAEEADGEIFV